MPLIMRWRRTIKNKLVMQLTQPAELSCVRTAGFAPDVVSG